MLRHSFAAASCFALLRPADSKTCDISDYGAKESASENSNAIHAAIADCLSGGEVVVPSGTFKTKPLVIDGGKDFAITLSPGSALQGLPRESWPSSGGRFTTFVTLKDCQRCALQGKGMLDGQGTPWYIDFDDGKISDHRPDFLVFDGGSDIKLLDVTLLNAPMFNVKLKKVIGAEIGGINITSHWYSNENIEPHNTDGIDPGSGSQDVWIHDVYIYNGDDSIAIKPGDLGACSKNILVENSHFERGHGLSIGSVGKGCIENVYFRNIKLSGKGTQNGCRIKTYNDKPGYVRNITWENIEMTDTSHCITVNADYSANSVDSIQISDINFINVTSTSCKQDAEFICDSRAPCTDISLKDVHVSGGSGMSCSNAFGTAKNSISSCLKTSPSPSPSPSPAPSPPPSPTPSPSPSPAPSPKGCDVDACLARCETSYSGKVDDGSGGDAYMCAKGCADMSDGHVKSTDKYCKLDAQDRAASCMAYCPSASSNPSNVEKCEFGCGFWAASPSPSPSPSACDVDGCFGHCEAKYGGSVVDADQGDAYVCAKGCAGMSGGRVSSTDKYCKLDAADRQASCTAYCPKASSDPSNVEICNYGCSFWATSEGQKQLDAVYV